MSNPFTPTFGIVPPYLAGRETLLQEMRRALQDGPGNPNLSSLLTGPRGSGKTALLSRIAGEAITSGWVVARTTAAEGMLEDILQDALKSAAAVVGKTGKKTKTVTALSVGQFLGIEWAVLPSPEANWRTRMGVLLDELKKKKTGLLITVDEVRADLPEMVQLASVYQLLLSDGAKIGLVMAGLPAQVNDLLNHEQTSFLRRCTRHRLGSISDAEIADALKKTITSAGKRISGDAVNRTTACVGGYAYMMQLAGFYIWEEADGKEEISVRETEQGIRRAQDAFRTGVLDSTVRELSRGDRNFLRAMLPDKSFSNLPDIAERLNKGSNYISTYKKRLLRAGILEEGAGKTLSFAIPMLREYLEEN
ncbi:MAG: ATP-binding protein [Lachnospiraceae bacterium]|nr:ATP-binding protein [Lachnospiraceae bacterium]